MTTDIAKEPTSLENMIIKAIEVGNIDTIEKMLALKERVDKENARKAFKAAFAEFQANKPDLVKVKSVSHDGGKTEKYKFLPLPKLQKAIDPILAKFGLSYRFEQIPADNQIEITCILSHLDGHEERTSLRSSADTSGNKNAIQSIGSAVSYLKRYTLEAATGISSDEDDDGKSAIREEKQLPEMTPDHPKWNSAVESVAKGQYQLKDVKTKKSFTQENEALFIEQVESFKHNLQKK